METIHEAKKSLEKKIISNEYVASIGTRQRDSDFYIEVGVLSEENIPAIKAILTEDKWLGYLVEVVVKPLSTPLH